MMPGAESKHMCLFLIVTAVLSYSIVSTQVIRKEICHLDTFTAECNREDVIVMKTAFYGLMQMSSCLPVQYDSIGCYNDVIPYFDEKCSGKRTCSVRSTDETLMFLNSQCPRRIAPYIEISYVCTKGKLLQNIIV